MTLSTHKPTTVVARLERQLAIDILRGRWPASSHLPPVRTLATTLGVTVPTIQRVVERLESTGLVTAKRGSGITVNDPTRCRDLTLLPFWFEALADDPERSAEILGDFLELRRVVACHLIRTSFVAILETSFDLSQVAGLLTDDVSVDDLIRTELELTQSFIDATGHFAAGAVFHTTERLLYQVPFVAEALYGDRSFHRRIIRRLLSGISQNLSATEAAEEASSALESWDRRTIKRFRKLRIGYSPAP